jgi:DNA-binding CsgD family transcriptional regulator/tetratricopeptide (TPR) repeat protein
VVVAGEAGVGKTRLVAELINRAETQGAVVLTGRCLDVGDGVLPYAPVAEALRQLARSVDEAELDRVLGDARGYLVRLVPELGPRAAPSWESAAAEPSAPGRLFELLLGVLHGLAERGPVLLVMEDLQWADRSTRDLLAFLVRNVRAGVLLVLTYRSDDLRRRHPLRAFLAELERGGQVERVELARLRHGELAHLLAGILDRPAPPAVVGEIMARSEGNPFYAEELLAARVAGVTLPLALRDLLLTRVEAPSEPTRQMLGMAAVAGRYVDHGLLAEVSGLPAERLIDLLREAVDHHVLAVEESAAGEVYAFRHALFQEAVYGDLLAVQRAPLHAVYAAALARRIEGPSGVSDPGPATAVELGQLAYHWYTAGEPGPALLAYVRAGLAAEATIALAEAQQYFQRAAQLWDQVPDAAEHSPLDRAALLERAAHAAFVIGDHDGAVALARRALADLDRRDPLRVGALLGWLARYCWAAADPQQAMVIIEEAVATTPVEPPSRERASVLTSYGRLLMLAGRNAEARQRSEEALAVARLVGARAEEGQALNTLGSVYNRLGRADLAVAHLEQARRIAEEIGNADDLCRAYHNLAITLAEHGRDAESVTVDLDGCRTARRLGLMRGHGARMLGDAAETLVWLGRWAEAAPLFDELFDLDLPDVYAAWAVFSRVSWRMWRGDFDAARADFAQLRSSVVVARDPEYAASVSGWLADLDTWEGRLGEATALVSDSLAAVVGSRDTVLVVRLCQAGLSAEAAIAEHARARGAVAEHEAAVDRATLLREQAHAAISAADWPTSPYLVAVLATIDAEWTRTVAPSDPDRWNEAAQAWETLRYPFHAAYARWRQAEALLASGAPRHQITAIVTDAWQVAHDLGARALAAEIEALARRARIKVGVTPDGPEPRPNAGDEFHLTNREREVLALLADGRTNRQIAKVLYISDKTASVHVSNILTKLGVANRGEAAAVAHQLGLT